MSPSTLALLVSLLGTICSFVYIFRQPKHGKTGRKLPPPGPRPLPVIGNLHMLGKLPHQSLHQLAKIYGPIMSLRLGNVPTIVVSSPEAAELFLKTHDLVFANRPKLQASEYLSYGKKGMVFSDYGPYWRTVRKWFTLHLLSASKVESFAPLRKAQLRSMVESLKAAAAAGETVDLSRKVGELLEDTTFNMVFGRPKEDGLDLKALIREVLKIGGAFNLSDFLPFLAPLDLQGLARKSKRISKSIDKFLEKVIDEHEHATGTNAEQTPHKDFVDVMVSLMNKPMNPHDKLDQQYIIERTNIKAILVDMVTAAFDTSTSAIEWTLAELLRHPRVMSSLQQEIESVVGRNRMVEESDLPKLTYLDMVVKESLRLHPVVPFHLHESSEDVTVNGYFIQKNSRIIINTWSIGRDRNVWSDNAGEFIPERFADSNIDLRGQDFQLIPFGSGRRGCPGLQLGLLTIRLVLAQLVHCFDWKLPDDMSFTELDMEGNFGLTLPRANHLLVKPTYRLHEEKNKK